MGRTQVYTLDEEVGRGGFSIVYRCTHRETAQDYACKVIDKAHPDYDVEEMSSEIRIAKLVSGHPNIASLVDVFTDDARWYLVQELVVGGELFDIVIKRCEAREEATGGADARPYTEREASAVVRQLVDAVGYCHSKVRGPGTSSGSPRPVVCTAVLTRARLLGRTGLAQILPPAGLVFASSGTPEYVAPEVVARPATGYGTSCDMWCAPRGVLPAAGRHLCCRAPPA